ncbi:hypothetical protein ASE91_14175 [Sphingomonas sp. Leaf62]|nr:hypothetical protein ASE91_14175 [Sphingomonas sp. Leaf62]
MTHKLRQLLRASLWLLLLPAAAFAFIMFVTGLTFGTRLWSARDPLPTVLWFATLALPILIMIGLRDTAQSIGRLLFSTIACWGFAVWYLLVLHS